MTKANMMREAHKLAKTFEGDYQACLALALRTLNSKTENTMSVEEKILFLAEEEGVISKKWENYGKSRIYFSYINNNNVIRKAGYFDLIEEEFYGTGINTSDGSKTLRAIENKYNN